MSSILDISEIKALDNTSGLIRIPNQIDVPVTPRVLRLIDTPEFQRLKHISQLGVVAFVYPAANHSRFEHSLGVYRMALLFLRHLAYQDDFAEIVTQRDATILILAALFHDIGHWPYCHPIEDLNLDGVPDHESFGSAYINSPAVADHLRNDWEIEPDEVIDVINKRHGSAAGKILGSILSGPIDIDKMDYLYRDSLHAGVPYGQNFDSSRLIRSLCLNESKDRLAITHKGKTAAELMVFARYVMFSEVYWHHAVRSATAMFQRAFYLWHQQQFNQKEFSDEVNRLFRMREPEMIAALKSESTDPKQSHGHQLLEKLFGDRRALYKRIANYNSFDGETIYRAVAQQPYEWVVKCSEHLAKEIESEIGRGVAASEILIDAPPVGLEVQFNVDVFDQQSNRYRELGEISPVVQTLARQQFDDIVKQVRVFVAPEFAAQTKSLDIDDMLLRAIEKTA